MSETVIVKLTRFEANAMGRCLYIYLTDSYPRNVQEAYALERAKKKIETAAMGPTFIEKRRRR